MDTYSLCKLTAPHLITWPVYVYLLLMLTGVFYGGKLLIKEIKKAHRLGSKIVILISSLLIFAIIAGITGFITILFTNGIDDVPPTHSYHPLNAAVKLRCFEDENKIHCPKNENDVRNIAPDAVKEKLQNARITYEYYSESDDYTLIIRNNDYENNNHRVALFDSRLVQAREYGRRGLDLHDAPIISNCKGGFKLTNPPPFPGPWDVIK